MKTKLMLLFAAIALASFGLVACGDDDDEEPAATPAEETTPAEEPEGGAEGGSSTVTFTADPGGDLAFEEDSTTAEAGDVILELTNESQVPHDVRIEGPDGDDLGGTDEITGGEASSNVQLEPGEYTFYCSVPGHREAGMEGTLTAE